MEKLDSRGFAHHFLLAIVVLGVAIFGTYQLVKSRAASLPQTSTIAASTTTAPTQTTATAAQNARLTPATYKLAVDGPTRVEIARDAVHTITGKAKAGSTVSVYFHFLNHGSKDGQLIYGTRRDVTVNAQGIWTYKLAAKGSFRFYAANQAKERTLGVHVVAIEKLAIDGPVTREVAPNSTVVINGRITNSNTVDVYYTPQGGTATKLTDQANTNGQWSVRFKVTKPTTYYAKTADGQTTRVYALTFKTNAQATTPAQAQSQAAAQAGAKPQPKKGKKVIYMVGDSYLKQALDKDLRQLVTKAGGTLHANGNPGRAINNLGANKQTGLQALEADKALVQKADVIIVALGTNGGNTPENIDAVMRSIKAKNNRAQVYWMNVGAIKERKSGYNVITNASYNQENANLLRASKTHGFKILNWCGQVFGGSAATCKVSPQDLKPGILHADNVHYSQPLGRSKYNQLVLSTIR